MLLSFRTEFMKAQFLHFVGLIVVFMSPVISFAEQPLDQGKIQSIIDSQCMREIRESKVWRNALTFKSQQEQASMKKAACQCVYDNSIQDVAIKGLLASPSKSEAESRDLISTVVLKKLRTCTQQTLN